MFFYLLKFLRASLRRERAQFELHFILLLRAVAVGAVIFLVPRIYRVRVVEVFLCELIEIVIKAGELSSKRLQSDGAVYDLKMMIMNNDDNDDVNDVNDHDLLPPVDHGLA